MESNSIKISGIVEESIVDGPGIRYVIFSQICFHRCKGCHNPDSHSPSGGTYKSIDDIIKELKENPLIEGVTFSGGDPMFQPDKFLKLAQLIKKETNLNIWCYTGFVYEDLMQSASNERKELLNYVDVLIDGPFIEDLKDLSLLWKGSSNQSIIDIQKSIKQGKKMLYSID